jgi:hypothetical protein
MDEFHFYADPDRGWAWQVALLELTGAQFLLMSATLGDVSELAAELSRALTPQFAVTPAMVLNVIARPGTRSPRCVPSFSAITARRPGAPRCGTRSVPTVRCWLQA